MTGRAAAWLTSDRPSSALQARCARLYAGARALARNPLALSGLARELALHCEPAGVAGSTLRLRLAPSHEQLTAARLRRQLAEALEQRFGAPVTLEFEITSPIADTPARAEERREDDRRRAAVAAIESDDAVRAICETFGTRVDPRLVQPAD